MLHSLANECSPDTTVHNVSITAESLPPLVHIGDTITDKDYIPVIQGQDLEDIIPVAAERVGSKHLRNCKQKAERNRKHSFHVALHLSFSNIYTDPHNSDYTLDVQWENYGEMNQFLSVLTGLTFYIVPSSSKDTNIVTAKLINNKTKKEQTVMLQDGVTMWQEILLLPLVFFKNPFVEINDVQNDLIDNLIIWTHKNI